MVNIIIISDENEEKCLPKKTMSLLNGYRHPWKSRNNHFLRYSDLRPKEERKPTLSELANQKHALQKLNGWKIYHLNSQMEDMVSAVFDRNIPRMHFSLVFIIVLMAIVRFPIRKLIRNINKKFALRLIKIDDIIEFFIY